MFALHSVSVPGPAGLPALAVAFSPDLDLQTLVAFVIFSLYPL